ncbi:MAG: hypothetical protein PHR51_01315 [Patescibacteria group bacterium]|nr:hypothetical protein [Patescibacteria group bacterium]
MNLYHTSIEARQKLIKPIPIHILKGAPAAGSGSVDDGRRFISSSTITTLTAPGVGWLVQVQA